MEERLLLLLVVVLLTVVRADPTLPSKEAFDKQVKLYNELMGDFMRKVQITKITLKDRGEFELYKVGKNDIELKTVFDLLQNWYHYIAKSADENGLKTGTEERIKFIQTQRYFELNIGGEDYKFGIELNNEKKEIIIVGEDGTAPPYSDLYKTFSDSEHGIQKIAKQLLNAADSPISKQPDWADTITNAKVRDDMRMFSVITQIAEGARPSEKFFKEMQTVSRELTSTRVASLDAVDAVLKKNMYEPISSIVKSDEYNVETYSQYRDFVTVIEQAQVLLEKIKLKKPTLRPPSEEKTAGEESPIASEKKDEFFEKLKEITFGGKNKPLKDLLKEYGLSYKGSKINALVSAAKKLQKPPEGKTNTELEKAVENTLASERVPKKIPLSPETKEKFFQELKNINVASDDNVIKKNVKNLLNDYKLKLIRSNDFEKLVSDIKSLNSASVKSQEKIEKDIDDAVTVQEQKTLNKEEEDKKFVALNREISDKILKTLKITKHNDDFFETFTSIDLDNTVALKSTLASLDFDPEGHNLDNLLNALRKLKEERSKPDSTASRSALRQAVENALPPVSKKFCKMLSEAARKSHNSLKDNTFAYYNSEVLPEVEGRIPGAGDLVRHLLKQLETGKINSFEDISRISLFMEVNGLIPSRIQAIEQFSFTQDQIRVAYDNAIESLHLKTSAVLESMKESVTELVGACSNIFLTEKKMDCKRSRLIDAELYNKQADESCGVNDKEKLVEDSLKWKGDLLEYETINEKGIKKLHKRKISLKENELSRYINEEVETKSHLTKKFGTGVGAYGTFVAIVSSIKQFEDGNYGQGALSAAQAIHSIGGLTGMNEMLSRKIIKKSLDIAAEKFAAEKILAKLSEGLAEGLGRAGKVFSRFLGDIPFVGLAFDIYFITEDIKDLANTKSKTPMFLKVTHLILDVSITILNLVQTFQPEFEPIIEPIVIALTVVRITIDDFYTDIKSELDKVKGKSFGKKFDAFWKGFEKGVADVVTLGLVTQLDTLDKASRSNKKLFKNMKNPENYFNKTLAQKGEVDFNGGSMSQYGGFLSVTLNDNGTFTMELPEVYVGETPRKVVKTFKFDKPAKDFVLGLGTTVSPQYIHQTAKLWLLIPIKSYDILKSFLLHNSSHYGTYYGNKYNNNFYAVQQANIFSDYHYNLHGRDGDDKFFLGPQNSFVLGGEGRDIYFIPSTGGETTIDNFALDENTDTLYINITYNELTCSRVESDLVIANNATTAVILNRWFLQGDRHDYFRHIRITTKDGVDIDATSTSVSENEHKAICKVASINKIRSKQKCTIDLRNDSFSEAKQLVGSNFSDTIIGNEMDNVLVGGLGNDVITGGNGSDKYLFKAGDGLDRINNYATDNKMDTILFGINYEHIFVKRYGHELVLFDATAPQKTKLIIESWFKGEHYQHASFISKDYIIFVVNKDGETITKNATIIDLSKRTFGVTVDLQNQNGNNDIQLNSEVMHDVKVLFDSSHDDRLIGNQRNNIMSCSGGTDYLQGNAGSDTYVVKKPCKMAKILNYDNRSKPQYDVLLFNCESSKIEMLVSGTDLKMLCRSSSSPDVVLIKWFESSLYQHLIVKTLDIWTFSPPEKKIGFSSTIEPYEIEVRKDCNGQRYTFNLNKAPFQHVQKIKANSSLCEYKVVGNNLNNYLDLGPSNSFGYRALEGGNGSDTYVLGYRYGFNNRINNFATDGQYDHLLFNVIYEHIEVIQLGADIKIFSELANNTVSVKLLNFLGGHLYQHLLIHSSDGIIFQIKMVNYDFVKQISLVSYSNSPFSQIISAKDDDSLKYVRAIIGSGTASNSVFGGPETMKISGGDKNDTIIGGSFARGEEINGMDGDDYIDGKEGDDNVSGGDGNDILIGGTGNDVIYGGKGADTIRGGNGSDTVVFSGSGKTKTGVLVNLQSGTGWHADAHGDTYESIENILGSEYNDSLIGNDDNNFISGYAGEDYIIPAGGMDNLKGGLDFDIYDMKNAFGLKIINNFATDRKIDTLLLSDISRQQLCYFYTGDDLYLNIEYRSSQVPRAMGRAFLGEGQLQIKLVSWLSNSTYQHLRMIFSSGSVSNGNGLSEDGRQMRPTINALLNKTTGIKIASISEQTVVLSFNVQFINAKNPLPTNTELIWVHSGYNKVDKYPVKIDSKGDPGKLTVTNLKQGIKHLFYVMLTSCNVTVAVSSLKVAITAPNPPVNITVYPVVSDFDGFAVHWLPPDQSTDPNAFYYKYTIKYWKQDTPDQVQVIEHNDFLFRNYTAFDLERNTNYELAIASKMDNTTGRFSPSIKIHTGYLSCLNFFNLPNNSHIESVKNHHGKLYAFMHCNPGYKLKGVNKIECNKSSLLSSQCVLLHCDSSLEDSINAVQVTGSRHSVEGESVIWKCSKRTLSRSGEKYFSSDCVQGIWNPPPRPCVPALSCSNYPTLLNGNVDPPFALVNETITFSCMKSYTRKGPEKKVCIRNNKGVGNQHQSTLSYFPKRQVECVRLRCPELLPQSHGTYSITNGGVVVHLVCHVGYFVSTTDNNNPERQTLRCNKEGKWSVPQKSCQPMLVAAQRDIKPSVSSGWMISSVRFTVPQWKSRSRLPANLNQFACDVLGLHRFKSKQGMTVTCKVKFQLTDNPPLDNGNVNPYRGHLTLVHSALSTSEKICVEYDEFTTALLRNYEKKSHIFQICGWLGLPTNFRYTSISVTPYQTTKVMRIHALPSDVELRDETKMCKKIISCRQTCEPLRLDSAINKCSKMLEGEHCSFKCRRGSLLLGSPTRTCLPSGDWSGRNNNCDADKWKADVDRIGKANKNSENLHEILYNHLTKQYAGVSWLVLVYPPVKGYAIKFRKDNYYKKTNYYGNNIVVARILSSPSYKNFEVPEKLKSAILPNLKNGVESVVKAGFKKFQSDYSRTNLLVLFAFKRHFVTLLPDPVVTVASRERTIDYGFAYISSRDTRIHVKEFSYKKQKVMTAVVTEPWYEP